MSTGERIERGGGGGGVTRGEGNLHTGLSAETKDSETKVMKHQVEG